MTKTFTGTNEEEAINKALSEKIKLEQNGGRIITLGKRILRTETVAIAMASAIMYEFDNLG